MMKIIFWLTYVVFNEWIFSMFVMFIWKSIHMIKRL